MTDQISADYRILDHTDFCATKLARPTFQPKGNNAAAKRGLRYENRVGRELQRHVDRGRFVKLEHNPWFTYTDKYGTDHCSPDFLLWTEEEEVIIVEVKLSWVGMAMPKLLDLYCPVVTVATNADVAYPLVICRNITNEAPPAKHSLREALDSDHGLLHWPDNGHIIW